MYISLLRREVVSNKKHGNRRNYVENKRMICTFLVHLLGVIKQVKVQQNFQVTGSVRQLDKVWNWSLLARLTAVLKQNNATNKNNTNSKRSAGV